jgi:hypothetical protein
MTFPRRRSAERCHQGLLGAEGFGEMLTAALVFEFFGSVSQLKENERCVYYLYIIILYYTIDYIYISYT